MAEEFEPDVLSESENFGVWRTEEEEGWLYHIELGVVTIHLTLEEWDEFLTMMKAVAD